MITTCDHPPFHPENHPPLRQGDCECRPSVSPGPTPFNPPNLLQRHRSIHSDHAEHHLSSHPSHAAQRQPSIHPGHPQHHFQSIQFKLNGTLQSTQATLNATFQSFQIRLNGTLQSTQATHNATFQPIQATPTATFKSTQATPKLEATFQSTQATPNWRSPFNPPGP